MGRKPENKTNKVVVWLDDNDKLALEGLAKNFKVTMSEVLRYLIRERARRRGLKSMFFPEHKIKPFKDE